MLTKPAPVLHCDWLQASVKWGPGSMRQFANFYTVKKLNITTRHFNRIEEVYIGKKRIATVTSQPCSEILDKDLTIVKFDNWLLYANQFRKVVSEFFSMNGLEFISISRIDFCGDFNEFDNGMLPDKFIKKYIYRRFLRKGRTPHVTHHFGQGKKEHYEKGLKFGSNLSEVTAYIYDKSRQMETEEWKPWIYMAWKKGGLDVERKIWRIEFSVKSGGILKANTDTGELDLFLTLQVIESEYIYKCFYKLYERYFSFVWNDGQVRKDRMRLLKLFKYIYSPEVLVHAEPLETANRSKKIFIKKLHELNNEMRGAGVYLNIYMDEFKTKLIEDAKLQSWAMKHGLNNHI